MDDGDDDGDDDDETDERRSRVGRGSSLRRDGHSSPFNICICIHGGQLVNP